MAESNTAVNQQLSNVATATNDFVPKEGGIIVVEFEWISGTPTPKIEMKIPGGTNFLDAVDENGIAVSKALTTNDKLGRFVFMGQAGATYRASQTGTGVSNIAMSRAGTI